MFFFDDKVSEFGIDVEVGKSVCTREFEVKYNFGVSTVLMVDRSWYTQKLGEVPTRRITTVFSVRVGNSSGEALCIGCVDGIVEPPISLLTTRGALNNDVRAYKEFGRVTGVKVSPCHDAAADGILLPLTSV